MAATFSAAWGSAASIVPRTSLAANEHDAEAALHPPGELGGGVFGLVVAGWHGGMNLD
jgi:hypothetical protein